VIYRLVEYAIRCDATDCYENAVWGARTRAECADEAPAHGWVRTTRNRWLCRACAERAERAAKEPTP